MAIGYGNIAFCFTKGPGNKDKTLVCGVTRENNRKPCFINKSLVSSSKILVMFHTAMHVVLLSLEI